VTALLEARADVHAAKKDGVTPLYAAVCDGRLEAALALIRADAQLSVTSRSGLALRDVACLRTAWPGGTPLQFMAILDATHSAVHRGWLLGARAWLMGGEYGAVRLGRRLCYGCKAARPIDGPTASLCPRGCGGVPLPPAEDGVHDMWFCSAACYASAAGRHRAVCDQGLRWAAAAAEVGAAEAARQAAAAFKARPQKWW
jgi:hypothetical protein